MRLGWTIVWAVIAEILPFFVMGPSGLPQTVMAVSAFYWIRSKSRTWALIAALPLAAFAGANVFLLAWVFREPMVVNLSGGDPNAFAWGVMKFRFMVIALALLPIALIDFVLERRRTA